LPDVLGRQVPATSAVDEQRAGPAQYRPQHLVQRLLGHDQRAIAGLQVRIERVEQPHQLGRGRRGQLVDVHGRQPRLFPVDAHLGQPGGPDVDDVGSPRVEVAGDIALRGRAEQGEVGLDQSFDRAHIRLGDHPRTCPPVQHWRCGAGFEFQPGRQCRRPHRGVGDVHGIAAAAIAPHHARNALGDRGAGHAFACRLAYHRAHRLDGKVELLERGNACLGHARAGLVQACGGVGLRQRVQRARQRVEIRAPVYVRRAPQ